MGVWIEKLKEALRIRRASEEQDVQNQVMGVVTKRSEGHPIFAGVVAAIVFLVLLFVIRWPFWVDLVIAAGILLAIQFLSQPVARIGQTPVHQIPDGERALAIYRKTRSNLDEMTALQYRITDSPLFQKTGELVRVGQDIFLYLTQHPKQIVPSEHFLNYYWDTANRILKNYVDLQSSNLDIEEFSKIREKTSESITYLTTIFKHQRDGYHRDAIEELAEESELLEKTVQMGGGRQ